MYSPSVSLAFHGHHLHVTLIGELVWIFVHDRELVCPSFWSEKTIANEHLYRYSTFTSVGDDNMME